MGLFEKVRGLPLEVDGYRLQPLQQDTGGGWTRHTTVVALTGGGLEGRGEDVTYADVDQRSFQDRGPHLSLQGRTTFGGFSSRLSGLDLFTDPPLEPKDRNYRTWAFESAALDLALHQAGRSLAEVLGRRPGPVAFVVSTGLGEPPSVRRLEQFLQPYPGTGFKVDLAESWTESLVTDLARTGAVRVVDLKGQYRGNFKGPAANPDQYRWVAEKLPVVWIEDPELNDRTSPVLEAHRDRITWDAILHSVDDIRSLPFPPKCINIKPSRFGTVAELLAVYEHCESRGVRMYGGGQFELGPGRGQIQHLASLFHPDAPNDVAPQGFNEQVLPEGLPTSPLTPAAARTGFGWETTGA